MSDKVRMPLSVVKDPRLDFTAKGLLLWLLPLPSGSTVSLAGLPPGGHWQLLVWAIDELKSAGYLDCVLDHGDREREPSLREITTHVQTNNTKTPMPEVVAEPSALIPLELVQAMPHRKGHLFVYAWLSCLIDQAGGNACEVAIDRLAADCRMKKEDVRLALRWLVAEGWVTRHDRPGLASAFQVHVQPSRIHEEAA